MRSRRTLALLVVAFMLIAVMHVSAGTVYASAYSCAPLVIREGFNADGVLEKDGKADYMDNEKDGSCFYADPDRGGSLPANGVINTTSGGYFKLGKYDQNNFLRLGTEKQETLSFDDKSCIACKNLSFLVTACGSGAEITATVHFADTEETMTTAEPIKVKDWSISDNFTAYRCGRYSKLEYEEADNYYLFERRIDIPEELQGYKVTSVDLNLYSEISSSCKACIFAVTATPVEDTRSVIYDANGGSLIFSSGVDFAPVGNKITLPRAERGEDALDGWYNGETMVGGAEESYTVTDNVILTAKWKTVFIRVLLYGESSTPQKYYQKDDGTYEHPERVDYTFKGFSQTQDGELIDESALVPGNTYYAVWEENPFVLMRYDGLSDEPIKIYLTADHFITGHEGLPEIGTKLSEDMVVGGYFSDAEYTKPVDVHSPVTEELFGKTIYVKLGPPEVAPPDIDPGYDTGDDAEDDPIPANDPNQKAPDGTAVGPGASAAAAENAIMSVASEEGPDGTKYATLQFKSTKQAKSYVRLTWTRAKGAARYVIYGNAAGKKNKMKKLASVSGSIKTKTINKIAGKKLGKGKYYKFIIVALDSNNKVVSTSKVIHAATKGGKVGNNKSVTVKKSVIAKAKKLKKGKSLKLNAKAVKASKLAVKKYRAVSYESSNPKIATVSKKGVVKGRTKGTCYIYAYAQNGVFKKIKVVVR